MAARAIGLLLALAVAALALPPLPVAASTRPLEASLDAAHQAFSGTAGIVVIDPATGFHFSRNGDMQFYSASLYKVWMLVEAYRQAAEGTISLDEISVEVTEDDLPWADGWYTPAGTELTVREALEMSITWSDNSTALALLRTLGRSSVNATLWSLGLHTTWLDAAGGNLTTAGDMAHLFALMLKGQLVSPDASREMLDVLSRQNVRDRLPAGLPDDVAIAHKTGDLWNVAHDAGVIWTPFGPRIAVVLTARARQYSDVVTLAASVAASAYADRVTTTERLAATIEPMTFPADAVAGRAYSGVVRVTNTSTFTWSGERLTVGWVSSAGTRVPSSPVALPPLEPGASKIVVVQTMAPAEAGAYSLRMRVHSPTLGRSTPPVDVAVQVAAGN